MSTTLPGTVKSAAPGLLGFDADTVISAAAAQQFKQNGYSFCARYLSLGNGQNAGDLSNAEATSIINAGLALIAVQHVRAEGWVPAAALGSTYGNNAASNAASVGLPKGMNIWCDLEGIATGTAAQNVIDYCQAWYAAVNAAGYVPGLYVGANCILTGAQLYDLSFQHYWKSLSTVPEIPNRGYQLVQKWFPQAEFGIGIDQDTTQTDHKGGTVLWVAL
jgi:hypothetical protein